MKNLHSFPAACRIAIIGASGGIGSELVEQLATYSNVAQVFAFARTPHTFESAVVRSGFIDIADEESIARCAIAAAQEGPLDIVIVTTGLLWNGDDIEPEKRMRELRHDLFASAFQINAAGPAIVAKHFLPHFRKGTKTVFAALSARVGSIGDNRLGGWYAYRASKAALNMLLKTLSIEHARLWPQSAVVGLHPGTVDTALSRPFTENTAAEKLFTPQTAARYLIRVIDHVRPTETGRVLAWDGTLVED